MRRSERRRLGRRISPVTDPEIRSAAHILPHHPGIGMFQDVAMIHEGLFPRGRLVEGDENLRLVLDKRDVLPAREMRRGWRPAERQNTK